MSINKAMTTITGNKETPDFAEKNDIEKIKFSGFIAQEVEQAAKDAGYDFSGIAIPKKSTELYTLRYAEFVVPLVKAVQELADRSGVQQLIIETLQKQNETVIAETNIQMGKQQAVLNEQNKKIELLLKEIQLIKEKLK